ncbi:hypothetical protein BHE74_00032551 [Ensete ventricosum]|uniref:60S acidic ribosomal protein P1 n=1 Tax=Ensete ventricosum TaxID=4639 RepID=A0A444G697_ENSVE|nr:hypothetical protein B296_00015699 [Ensete ventricosum]RWW30396.1 hypothetical protein GW17_00005034 [Ensete ventricosum]RWW60460.1 hypothetical protein BHE74_00032551 [Ensete ventricosum]RZR75385.1 hypothetical protein BHM03_00056144 [Ensete ventricosum]
MSSIGELACTYAALILHDDGIPVTVLSVVLCSSRVLLLFAAIICAFLFLSLHVLSNDQSEKILTVVKAANLTIDSYWAPLFAKLLEKRSVDDLILSVGSGGGGASVAVSAAPAAGAGGGGAAAAAAPAAEEKKVRYL